MMRRSLGEANRVLKSEGQLVIVYAHKTTLGWATLVDALRAEGFTVTEAWPLDTEMSVRLRAMDSAALASSLLFHTDAILCRTARARSIFARMSSTFAVQVNDRGCRLWCTMKASMAAISSATLLNTPRRSRLVVSSRNQRSTRFNHELLVGGKWRWNRGWRASQAWTAGCLWVA